MLPTVITVLKNYSTYALIAYVILSMLFFKFPNLLHKKRFKGKIWKTLDPKKREKKKLWHISHRGGSRESLENTIEAFDNAVKNAKTDMLEFDVYLTKDKKVVVFHDYNLRRVMGVNKSIGELNYKEIPAFLAEFRLHFGIDYIY
jgi:glycerophosphoryl diester phosphodiesterase